MASKAAKKSQQPQQQYKILARPSSSDVTTPKSTPQLSEFETPRRTPAVSPDIIAPKATPEPPIENPLNHSSETSLSSGMKNLPVTPIRPVSMHVIPSHRHRESKASLISERRVSIAPMTKTQRRNQATSAFPNQNPARNTPTSANWPKQQTPVRSSVTPSQAYAGPTFHASPAASSLPMPTFFSKSVPEPRKSSGLKAMMEDDANGGSSDQADESPTLRKTRLDVSRMAMDDSPLDICFHADRNRKVEEKAKLVPSNEATILSPATSTGNLTDSSKSPSSQGTHQSSHTPNSSIGGLFPLDFEDSNYSSPSPEPGGRLQPKLLRDSERSASTPSSIPTQLSREQMKALALKQLLLSPDQQRPATVSPDSRVTGSGNHVSQAFPSPHNPSGPSIPLFCHDSESTNHGSTSGFPFFECSPSITPSGPSRHQATPSNLRQQVTSPKVTEYHRLPKFPTANTPPHTNESYNLLNRQSCAAALHNSPCREPNVPPQNSIPATPDTPLRDPAQTKLMEDYLRRVLKLDTLSSEGAKGVVT